MSPRRKRTTDLLTIPIRATPVGVLFLLSDRTDMGTQKPMIHINLKITRPGVDFINPFKLYPKLLRSELNFLCLKKLLKSWAQSVKWLCSQLLAFMKSTPEVDFMNPFTLYAKLLRSTPRF